MKIGKTFVSQISLRLLLFQGVSPTEFFGAERKRIEEDLSCEAGVGGVSVTLEEIDSFYDLVMKEIAEDEIFRSEMSQRNRLMQDIRDYLGQVEMFVRID